MMDSPRVPFFWVAHPRSLGTADGRGWKKVLICVYRRCSARRLIWFGTYADMDVTYRCNERCGHCYLDHDDHGEMTLAKIRDVLD
jgi:hypothetical protein